MIVEGCARVEGDEEEDGIDDMENEFDFDERNIDEQEMQIILDHEVIMHLNLLIWFGFCSITLM